MKRISMAVAVALGAMASVAGAAVHAGQPIGEAINHVPRFVQRDVSSTNRGKMRPGRFAAAQKRAPKKARNLRLHPRR